MKIHKYKFPFKMTTCQRELIQERKIMSELDTNILSICNLKNDPLLIYICTYHFPICATTKKMKYRHSLDFYYYYLLNVAD